MQAGDGIRVCVASRGLGDVYMSQTPSPHHPLGAKGVAESPTVGAPPAIANAVIDALSHLGVESMGIPITPFKVWQVLKDKGLAA